MLNNCQVIGHLGRDPEMKYSANGDAFCVMNVASSEKWKDKSGQPQVRTEWFRCIAYGRLAEVCGEYLHKGSLVYVSGSLNTRTYQNKDGVEAKITELKMREMKILNSKQQSQNQSDSTQQSMPEPQSKSLNDMDDDIPF